MIVVWLVTPPSEVAIAEMTDGSSPAVSAGARSSAQRTLGVSGIGMPGSGWPVSSASTRSRMSCRSLTRSAMRPPALRNMSLSCSTAATVATPRRWLEPSWADTRPTRPRSRARAAVATSTSAAGPLAFAARCSSRWATASAAAPNLSVPSSGVTSGSSLGTTGRGIGRTTGPVPMPGTTPVPCRIVMTETFRICDVGHDSS